MYEPSYGNVFVSAIATLVFVLFLLELNWTGQGSRTHTRSEWTLLLNTGSRTRFKSSLDWTKGWERSRQSCTNPGPIHLYDINKRGLDRQARGALD